MYFIIALAIIIFYLLVYDKLSRIADATEVGAQSLKSINKKLNAILKQTVPPEIQSAADADYDSKSQPKPKRMR
ncbi:MAG: hypothetical protein EOM45_12205 [Clostridia bacterium]|nr:hypothetical protein [Clostridia bacterium]